MNLKELLDLNESQMVLLTKAAKGNTNLLLRAKKSLERTIQINRQDLPLDKKRKYVKDYIKYYKELGKPTFTRRDVDVIEGRRLEELKVELNKQFKEIQKTKSLYNCPLCGEVEFHSQLAHWWRSILRTYQT